MTIELLKTIALLCQVSTGTLDIKLIEKIQNECHVKYVECLKSNTNKFFHNLDECIKRRSNDI